LDRNTTGALLITNDGDLAHRLTHPAYQIERTYKVGLDREMRIEDIKVLAHGVELEDGVAEPVELAVMPDDRSIVYITLREGRNREVRRMFETMGYDVRKLDRKSFAGITVSGLSRGEYRHLDRKEVMSLKRLVQLY
jgi:23S rRNA pseudouridine2605 synthase